MDQMESNLALIDNLLLSDDGESSDTLYIRGFPRATSTEIISNVLTHDNEHLHPTIQVDAQFVLIDYSEYQIRNIIRVKYPSVEMSEVRLRALQQHTVMGKVLSVKYELGVDPITKKPKVSGKTHNTIIRKIIMSEGGFPGTNSSSSLAQKRSITKGLYDTTFKEDDNCHPTSSIESDMNQSSSVVCKQCKRKPLTTTKSSTTIPIAFNYTYKSIQIHHNNNHDTNSSSKNTNTIEFPFPSGLYLTRTIELTRTYDLSNPLLRLVLNSDMRINHSLYAKEISESMAMVDALYRAVRMVKQDHLLRYSTRTSTMTRTTLSEPTIQQQPQQQEQQQQQQQGLTQHSEVQSAMHTVVKVYVLGDGKIPLSAACLCLQLPEHFAFYSIDPILQAIPLLAATEEEDGSPLLVQKDLYSHRFHQCRCMSEDFPLDCASDEEDSFHIIIACHSHAPLQEFWSRLTTSRKIAITMPCCADYANLQTLGDNASEGIQPSNKHALAKLLVSFDDFEVYSAKRKINIYTNVD